MGPSDETLLRHFLNTPGVSAGPVTFERLLRLFKELDTKGAAPPR